jgi:hypothetical protein
VDIVTDFKSIDIPSLMSQTDDRNPDEVRGGLFKSKEVLLELPIGMIISVDSSLGCALGLPERKKIECLEDVGDVVFLKFRDFRELNDNINSVIPFH